MATVEVTTQNFQDTIDQGGIVLIDWWAPWCGPCKAFGPVYERVAKKHPDITFGKINTEDQPALAMQFQINAIPTLMVIRDKTLLFSQPGMLPERALEDLIAQAEKLDMQEVKNQLEKKGGAEASVS